MKKLKDKQESIERELEFLITTRLQAIVAHTEIGYEHTNRIDKLRKDLDLVREQLLGLVEVSNV